MTSTECLCLAFISLLDFSFAKFLLVVLELLVAEPRLVRPVLCFRKEAQAMASWTTPACQM